jgi:HAD superfamily hydrolase (TIGR01509 family)
MVVSGDEGMVKPQREIYDLLRARIDLPAEELCFIDDVVKNVEGSRAAGWHAIRFVSNDQVEADFESLVAESR